MFCQKYPPNKTKIFLHAYQLNKYKQIHLTSRIHVYLPPNGSGKENSELTKKNVPNIDNFKSLPFLRKKFFGYNKILEKFVNNNKFGEYLTKKKDSFLAKEISPSGNTDKFEVDQKKNRPFFKIELQPTETDKNEKSSTNKEYVFTIRTSPINVKEMKDYWSDKMENSESLPLLRKKFIEYYQHCVNNWGKRKSKIGLGQKDLSNFQFETKENKTNSLLSETYNRTEMQDYYRKNIREYQEKSLLILRNKYKQYDKFVESCTGLDKVRIIQKKCKESQRKLGKAQKVTRRLKEELIKIQKDLAVLNNDIKKCDHDDRRFLALIKQKNSRICDEQEKLKQIKIAENEAHELFNHLTLDNKSFDNQKRVQENKFKYFYKTIKLIVALIGIFSIMLTIIMGAN